MTLSDDGRASGDDRRLLETLQRVLAIQGLDLQGALTQACNQIAEALGCEKVDIFLHEAATESLVALGTSETDIGRRQRQIGMDRQPIANAGVVARVFLSDDPYATGHADRDPQQLRGMIEGLGVRSEMIVPFDVQGERRGVLSAVSVQPELFAEADLPFLQAVGNWVGMVTHRTELFERVRREAARRGRRDAAEDLARLTRRRQEVDICIAEGLSNAGIADRLVLTEGTVANHIEHVLRQLGLASRRRSPSGPSSAASIARTRTRRRTSQPIGHSGEGEAWGTGPPRSGPTDRQWRVSMAPAHDPSPPPVRRTGRAGRLKRPDRPWSSVLP